MQLTIDVLEHGDLVRHIYRLFDRFDEKSGVSSMARTTGYTCTSAVRALAAGSLRQKGIVPPENLAREKRVFEIIRNELEKRGIQVEHTLKKNTGLYRTGLQTELNSV
jgi:saccharopine dehydrogenase-like NADP-dependent oxidoreductase